MSEGNQSEHREKPASGPYAALPFAAAAMLLDLDGVVTRTAVVHARAWKVMFDRYLAGRGERDARAYPPFDIEDDYRRHVDGKPRYDGVRDFLRSRGIELDQGSPDDPPGRETVCGLGNRKNDLFHHYLEREGVASFPTTLRLLRRARRQGIGLAVISSSRNCEAVLQAAGLTALFDAVVDGDALAALELPGKPDPAIFLEAAARLQAAPGSTAVFEDATVGVEAGRRGGFGLVVGVDRAGIAEALEARGAHVVVEDLGELALDEAGRLVRRTVDTLPTVREAEATIRRRIEGRRPAVLLDYDGTLTPIVADYTKAFLSDAMRASVDALSRRCPVAVISGRDLRRLQELVALPQVVYVGSHGFEIAGPDGLHETFAEAERFLPDLDAAEEKLRDDLADVPGHAVERKRFAIAVHYRQVSEDNVGRVEQAVDAAVRAQPRLRKGRGKKVFQVRPRTDWDKGRAVTWLLGRLGLDGPGTLPVYIGDDLTDEDAFRALADRGLGLVVRDGERPTAADYALADPEDVRRFIDLLTELAGGARP